jgi:riboflavin kinase/FMN adenylyltransferase
MYILEWDDFINNRDQETAADSPDDFAATIGVFDGVHRGHLALIERIHSRGSPVVITFKQNPVQILAPHSFRGDIYSLRQKLSVFEEYGVIITVLIDFSGNFSRISGKEFVDLLKKRRRLSFLAVGADFRCGHHLDTDAAALRGMTGREGIRTELVPPVMEGRHPVSSSRIRAAVAAGDLAGAQALLGRPIGMDLSGIPPFLLGRDRVFDLRAAHRIVPPSGSYTALVFTADSDKGIRTPVSVDKGTIIIPGDDGQGVLEGLVFLDGCSGAS